LLGAVCVGGVEVDCSLYSTTHSQNCVWFGLWVVLYRWFDSDPPSNLLSLLAAFDFPYVLGQVKCQSMCVRVCLASVLAALLKGVCGVGGTFILLHIKHLAFWECLQ